jgi:two-component system response regulator AlgR
MSARPLRLFLADDEPPARSRVLELLEDLRADCPTEVVGEAGNGLEVLDRLPETGAEVLLLDINMPGLSGLEVARHLSRLENGPAIVFVTAHDAHAVEAFELNALDYLLKPVRAAPPWSVRRPGRAPISRSSSAIEFTSFRSPECCT